MQRYGWDLAAVDYEALWQAQLACVQTELLARASVAPGEQVLDVACGTGLVSFKAALAGVWYTLRTQPNAWIELAACAVIVAAGWWFAIQRIEWAILGLTVFLILAMEAVNTAVEATIDLVSPRYHPLAKIAKDTAAGAMIFAVLGSLWVAIAIFGPRLWQLFFA